MSYRRDWRYHTNIEISNKCKPLNYLFVPYQSGVVYETDYSTHLRWKRPDLCPTCCGKGEYVWKHTMTHNEYRSCERCSGTGRKDPKVEWLHDENAPKPGTPEYEEICAKR